MPIPDKNAAERISRSVRKTEKLLEQNPKRGRRYRALEGDEPTIILGDTTAAVTGGANFSIDNLQKVFPAGFTLPTSPLDVINTLGLELDDGQKVYAIYNEDLEQWETFTAGEGSMLPPSSDGLKPLLVVRLTADVSASTASVLLGAYDTTKTALLPVAIGAAVSVGNALGFGSLGLAGQKWIVEWSVATGSYQLIQELIQCNLLWATVTSSSVHQGSATVNVDTLTLGQGRLPVDGSGNTLTSLTVSNKGKIAASSGDVIPITWDETSGTGEVNKWATLPMGDRILVAKIPGTIGAATCGISDITYGTGNGFLVDDAGLVTSTVLPLLSMSETPIEASTSQEPIYVAVRAQLGGYLILSDKDNRGVPGYNKADKQILVHEDGADAFVLKPFCYDEDFITEVLVEGDNLVYKYPDKAADCALTTVVIIGIGPCDTP